jgi:hypothetical protein
MSATPPSPKGSKRPGRWARQEEEAARQCPLPQVGGGPEECDPEDLRTNGRAARPSSAEGRLLELFELRLKVRHVALGLGLGVPLGGQVGLPPEKVSLQAYRTTAAARSAFRDTHAAHSACARHRVPRGPRRSSGRALQRKARNPSNACSSSACRGSAHAPCAEPVAAVSAVRQRRPAAIAAHMDKTCGTFGIHSDSASRLRCHAPVGDRQPDTPTVRDQ